MDFGSLSLPSKKQRPVDPIEIFESLPRLEGAPNDLWRGQADALREWAEHRDALDTLLSLNTGAGKTIVGLLMAQSLVNEGLENVLFVCPTNDLVEQTKREADRIGIQVTTRTESEFDNDLFESGKAFCVTNYHAVFNGLSALRRSYFPEAVIFDDAHVAEQMMRSSYSLKIASSAHKDLFNAILGLFAPDFRRLERLESLKAAAEVSQYGSSSVLVPPDVVAKHAGELAALMRQYGVHTDKSLKWAHAHLKDHIGHCAFVYRATALEITPPFLPSLSLDIFSERVRRIYLSATLHNKADIIRAFGRLPGRIIEPRNDAGNGERLIISERDFNNVKVDSAFVAAVVREAKAVIAVPSYRAAQPWESIARPPEQSDFSAALERFRNANSGAFILVSRVDGIDLPHDTCRVMIIDGVPRSEGYLERFQSEYLRMKRFMASRTANRLVQLFGRINRGRADFGAFLIVGRDLNSWLQNDRNVALLPELLRKQIVLGRHVQENMHIRTLANFLELLNKVIISRPRDQAWLDYYSEFLRQVDVSEEANFRAQKAEERNLASALAEAEYAKCIWEGRYRDAADAVEAIVADVARSDDKLAGWLNLWAGLALFLDGDEADARYHFARSYSQLGSNLIVDTQFSAVGAEDFSNDPQQVRNVAQLMDLSQESYAKRISELQMSLAALDGGTPGQMEESTRRLGETVGFIARRPDNEDGTGPDVVWSEGLKGPALGLELKTDKEPGSEYSKKEISQSLDHNEWLTKEFDEALGTVLVGPAQSISHQANPSEKTFFSSTAPLIGLRDRWLAAVEEIRRTPSEKRLENARRVFGDGWDLRSIQTANFSSRTPG